MGQMRVYQVQISDLGKMPMGGTILKMTNSGLVWVAYPVQK